MMTDMAEMWHWRPSDMWQMEAAELSEWRNRAIKRYNEKQEAKAKAGKR